MLQEGFTAALSKLAERSLISGARRNGRAPLMSGVLRNPTSFLSVATAKFVAPEILHLQGAWTEAMGKPLARNTNNCRN